MSSATSNVPLDALMAGAIAKVSQTPEILPWWVYNYFGSKCETTYDSGGWVQFEDDIMVYDLYLNYDVKYWFLSAKHTVSDSQQHLVFSFCLPPTEAQFLAVMAVLDIQ